MPVGGVWWLNVDRYPDAVSLLNQTLAAQDIYAFIWGICGKSWKLTRRARSIY